MRREGTEVADLVTHVDGRTHHLRAGHLTVIGRDPEATLTVSSRWASRFHLYVSERDGEWEFEDLETRNGTYLNGERVSQGTRVRLTPGMRLMLGDPVLGARVEFGCPSSNLESARAIEDYEPVAELVADSASSGASPASAGDQNQPLDALETITVGRAPTNSLVLDDPMVSNHHARLTRLGGGRYLVEDLRSTNGTFVNGSWAHRALAETGDIVSFGPIFLELDDHGLRRIVQKAAPAGGKISLSVSGVSFSVPVSEAGKKRLSSRKELLDQVTFCVPERSLLAIIGPSGAGKSTIVKAMTGAIRTDRGQVLFNGLDMALYSGSLADRIGMVPQEDVLHRELTAREALEYAARLRFPDDTASEEIASAVDWVLDELGLAEHARTRVQNLSGGQRKRVNTAMELLTKPDLLLLDEPTSGLDPNLDREVMDLLRDLAHGTVHSPAGRTVVVVTHSTDNLDRADNVLLMAPGGKVAYFGPPEQLSAHFRTQLGHHARWADIYAFITEQPDRAKAAYAASPLAAAPTPVAKPARRSRVAKPPLRRLLPQTWTLLSRQARLMVRDPSLMLFTLALPAVVGLLTLTVRAVNGFESAGAVKNTNQPAVLLVVVVFGAVLMGMVPSVRQLISERPIFLRESGVGVRAVAHLTSKIVLLGVVCAVQSAILVTVALALNDHPARGVMAPLWVELFAVAFGISWACAAFGLLLSALVSNSDQVMPLMVLVLMFQLIMCGGVFNVTGPVINQMSYASASRWAFAAGASSLDFNRTITCQVEILTKEQEDEEVNKRASEATDDANQEAADEAKANGLPKPKPKVADVRYTVVDCDTVEDQDELWAHSAPTWATNLLMLSGWFLSYLIGAWCALRHLLKR